MEYPRQFYEALRLLGALSTELFRSSTSSLFQIHSSTLQLLLLFPVDQKSHCTVNFVERAVNTDVATGQVVVGL